MGTAQVTGPPGSGDADAGAALYAEQAQGIPQDMPQNHEFQAQGGTAYGRAGGGLNAGGYGLGAGQSAEGAQLGGGAGLQGTGGQQMHQGYGGYGYPQFAGMNMVSVMSESGVLVAVVWA